jgi:hypothetical protein
MNRKTLEKISTAFVFVLLVLQAIIFFEEAHSFALIFRGAQNVSTSDPLPEFFWRYVSAACLFLLLAIAYVLAPMRIRQWFIVLAGLSFVYGIRAYQQSSSILLSWSGIFHGDIVALGAASAVVFCGLGFAGFLDWKIRRP